MIEIRKAYPTDAYTLVQIRSLAWKNNYYDIFPSDIIHDMVKEENVRHLEDQINENNRIFVAIDDDKIVGFVFYAKALGNLYDNAEIREIYVLPEYQKRGIGKLLFQKAVEALKQLRFTSFVVACPLHNQNVDFFIHMGGVRDSNREETFFGYSVSCDVIYFELQSSLEENLHFDDWNQLYMLAQNQLPLFNHLHKEVAILLCDSGHTYMGLGIKNKVCPIEVALSNMYLGKDEHISKILILNKYSKPVLPCGKCRDLLIELGHRDASILFELGSFKTLTMEELNPYYKDEER